MSTQRQRGEETPSRGPGLSEAAQRRLDERRRARDAQRRMQSLLAVTFGTDSMIRGRYSRTQWALFRRT